MGEPPIDVFFAEAPLSFYTDGWKLGILVRERVGLQIAAQGPRLDLEVIGQVKNRHQMISHFRSFAHGMA
jgi:hypothetical protein